MESKAYLSKRYSFWHPSMQDGCGGHEKATVGHMATPFFFSFVIVLSSFLMWLQDCTGSVAGFRRAVEAPFQCMFSSEAYLIDLIFSQGKASNWTLSTCEDSGKLEH